MMEVEKLLEHGKKDYQCDLLALTYVMEQLQSFGKQ